LSGSLRRSAQSQLAFSSVSTSPGMHKRSNNSYMDSPKHSKI
jgi:hypothetical protein